MTTEGMAVRTRPRGLRQILLLLMVPLVIIAVAWRVYRHLVPSGTDFYPYWALLDPIVEGPKLISPPGRRVIHVMLNDAGAVHSGNFWTWLIVDDWLTGKRVIAEGYSLPDVRYQTVPFPLRWLDDRTITVAFAAGRHENTLRNPVLVRLP
jgi:hypothetical protein